jgi:hypothetical protein
MLDLNSGTLSVESGTFRNNLNEFWDFYHGTKPPTWVLVFEYHFAMSTSLILDKSQTPQGYLLEEKKANKRMQGRTANITREKPPQRERERERERERVRAWFTYLSWGH